MRAKATKFLTRHTPTPSTNVGGFLSIDEYRLSFKSEPPIIEKSRWAWQFGLAWSTLTFKSPIATVILADTFRTLEYPHRIVALSDPPIGSTENVAIENVAHDLVPLLSISEILSRSENLVGGLRSRVFQRMSSRGLKVRLIRRIPGSFLRDIRLNSDLQTSRMILARLQLEYEQQSQSLAFIGSDLKGFVYSHELVDSKKQSTNLLEVVQKAIERNFGLVSKHLQLAFDSFSVHVALRNTAETYRLGRNVLWFTIVAAFATVLGIIGSWPSIVSGFKSMMGYLW